MRYLSWDDVLGLEKFLVEDNDEAIGMEIHTGIFDHTEEDGVIVGYNRPDKVIKISFEELAGGDFITLGDGSITLCAVVCNRLYYKDRRGWVYNTGTYAVYHGKYHGQNYEYERAVISFNCPIVPLPKDEILALDKFLVRDNKRVVGVRIIPGYMGIGGSNTSGFSSNDEKIRDYSLESLSTHDFIWAEGIAICALVNDVLHFRYTRSDGEVRTYTLDYRERDHIIRGDGIAYDTITATEVVLLLK